MLLTSLRLTYMSQTFLDYEFSNGCRAPPWRQVHGDISYIIVKPRDGDRLSITAGTSGYFLNKGKTDNNEIDYDRTGDVYPTLVALLKEKSQHFADTISRKVRCVSCVVLCCKLCYVSLYYVVLRCVALRCVALCCVVLCCVALRCVVLCCVVLCCVALRCVVLRCVALCCVVLCCVALRCVALCCVMLRCVALCCELCYVSLCYVMLCCVVLRCVALRCVALCCVALCYVMLCCVVLRFAVLCCVAFRFVALSCVALRCVAMDCVVFNRVLLILSHSSKDFAYHGSSNVVGDTAQQSVETILSHSNNNAKDANEEAPGRDTQEITDGNRLVYLIYIHVQTNKQTDNATNTDKWTV